MKGYLSVLIIIMSVAVVSCSKGNNQSQTSPGTSSNAGTAKQEKVTPVMVQEEQKKPEYQVIGIRDPFQPFLTSLTKEDEMKKGIIDPLQRISLSQIGIVGVILGHDKRALIQESSGMGYIIKEGSLVGENSGIVTGIAADGVTIKQHFKDYMGRVNTREIVLSLRKEEGVTGK